VKRTVLLVEDETDTRELLSRALEREGYACISAPSAQAAVASAKEAEFIDVVVTDVVMGRDDRAGLLLLKELRDIGVHAPVVVITAYADVEKVKMALNEGAAQFLEKPFRASELVLAVGRACEQGGGSTHGVDEVLTRAKLTDKERLVALRLLEGLSSGEIAAAQNNSEKTIRQHVSQIYAKCGVSTRAELFRKVYVR
jgi:DNA-binding NarL/FixJ family response regulator